MPFRGSVYLKPVARTDEQRKTIYLTVAIVKMDGNKEQDMKQTRKKHSPVFKAKVVAFLVHRLKVPIFVVVLWLYTVFPVLEE